MSCNLTWCHQDLMQRVRVIELKRGKVKIHWWKAMLRGWLVMKSLPKSGEALTQWTATHWGTAELESNMFEFKILTLTVARLTIFITKGSHQSWSTILGPWDCLNCFLLRPLSFSAPLASLSWMRGSLRTWIRCLLGQWYDWWGVWPLERQCCLWWWCFDADEMMVKHLISAISSTPPSDCQGHHKGHMIAPTSHRGGNITPAAQSICWQRGLSSCLPNLQTIPGQM